MEAVHRIEGTLEVVLGRLRDGMAAHGLIGRPEDLLAFLQGEGVVRLTAGEVTDISVTGPGQYEVRHVGAAHV